LHFSGDAKEAKKVRSRTKKESESSESEEEDDSGDRSPPVTRSLAKTKQQKSKTAVQGELSFAIRIITALK
jgi:hypothetical protein